ncbi:hypothetical protein [Desulfonatronum thiosulfatophilum]|uniref:hypothetical protein n=1 Tax=Desulfonatronum thiosulfatophilum TaxID=617002 RepID=UPI001114176C|nr:hypothetical protein [Desulfonatronum thiosulfatophilum]
MSVSDILFAALLTPLLPTALILMSAWLVRRLDDRGMYAVFPFSGLPIAAGIIFCWAMLTAMHIPRSFTVQGIWFSTYWALTPMELYLLWLSPLAMYQAWIAGMAVLFSEVLKFSWLAASFLTILIVAIAVAGLAWRNRQAWRGIALFFLLALTAASWFYLSVILIAWLVHWLNFWLLLLIFAVLYFIGAKSFYNILRHPL